MIIYILFAVGTILLIYGVYCIITADGFDLDAFIPLLVSLGIIGSVILIVMLRWVGVPLCDY